MTWNRRIAMYRFWLSEHPGVLGISLATLVLTAIILGFGALQPRTTGPVEEIIGRVISEMPPTDPQYYAVTRVVVELADGVRFTARPPITQTCRLGDQVVVARRQAGVGRDHQLLSCSRSQKSDDGPRQAG